MADRGGDLKENEWVLIYSTFSEEGEASRIVQTLLNERLIACANLWPIHSRYWWKGAIETTDETAVIMKTRAQLYTSVESRIIELHSYETPAVVGFPIAFGSPEYLNWVMQVTKS